MKRLGFALLLLLVCCGLALTQHPQQTGQNSVAIKEGAKLFAQNCSACHGDTGKGGRAPDLTSGQWKHGGTDEDLIRNIVKGIPGTQMPAIALTETEAKQVIAFLRTLSGKATRATNAWPGARSAYCSQMLLPCADSVTRAWGIGSVA